MENKDSNEIKQNQKRNFAIVVIVALCLAFFLFKITKDEPVAVKKENGKSNISHGIDTIEAEEIWREKSENRLVQQEEENQTLKKEVSDLKEKMAQMISSQHINDTSSNHSQEQQDYIISKLTQLEQQMNLQAELEENAGLNQKNSDYAPTGTQPVQQNSQYAPDANAISQGIFSYTLALTDTKQEKPNDKSIHNYFPIGSFGRAAIISGVDASTSLSAQSDPRPVLMRLLDHGSLPKNIKSRVKDCRVIGAGYGDISSERVYVRLETISCATKNGAIFEKPIHGYVAGEDGKDGIRGRVVWREGALLQRAFMAGTLGGIGQGVADTYVDTSVSPLGVVETTNTNDIFQAGLAQGGSNALNTLAEYNIKRAEAYQPVIEVDAGRIVEIVINYEGLYLRNPTLEKAEWAP